MHLSRELDSRLNGLKFKLVYVLFFILNKLGMFSAFGKATNSGVCIVFRLLIHGCAVCGRPNVLHGLKKIANIKKKLSLIFTDQLRNIELSYKGRNNLLK